MWGRHKVTAGATAEGGDIEKIATAYANPRRLRKISPL